MRRLWPFVGLALAVACGIALAPFVWWLVPPMLIVGAVAWARRTRPRLYALLWLLGALAVLGAWPAWLAWRGQYGDALFVTALIVGGSIWQARKDRRAV